MRTLCILWLGLLAGCATHASAVRCDRRLEPINMPVEQVAPRPPGVP
jgi:hypothetical protein